MYKDDRRMFERFDVDFPVEIKQPASQMGKGVQCCDVSASGAGLFTQEQIMPRTGLELSLAIPDGHKPFRGLARVIWSNQVQETKWRTGVEFERVDFMGLRRIFDKVKKRP